MTCISMLLLSMLTWVHLFSILYCMYTDYFTGSRQYYEPSISEWLGWKTSTLCEMEVRRGKGLCAFPQLFASCYLIIVSYYIVISPYDTDTWYPPHPPTSPYVSSHIFLFWLSALLLTPVPVCYMLLSAWTEFAFLFPYSPFHKLSAISPSTYSPVAHLSPIFPSLQTHDLGAYQRHVIHWVTGVWL